MILAFQLFRWLSRHSTFTFFRILAVFGQVKKAKEAEKAIGGKIITSRRDQPGIMVKGNHPKKKPSFRLVNYYCKLLLFYYYYFTTIIILLYLDLRTTHIVLMCWLVVSFPLYQPYPIEIFQFRITLILLSPGVAEKNPNSRPFLGWSDWSVIHCPYVLPSGKLT